MGLFRPVMALLYLYLYVKHDLYFYISTFRSIFAVPNIAVL
jgi:hypothetical protein